MSEITYSRPSDWDTIVFSTRGLSRRSTTSSRLPGKAIQGVVSFAIVQIVPCRDCGSMRRESLHPHSPRWVCVDGVHKQIDCAGREVTRG